MPAIHVRVDKATVMFDGRQMRAKFPLGRETPSKINAVLLCLPVKKYPLTLGRLRNKMGRDIRMYRDREPFFYIG